jgi:DNA repair exonuclease SbcCD ATPase subunit
MRLTRVFLAALVTFTAAGCGGGPDSVMREQIKVMDEYTAILQTVKSKDDLEKNRSRLVALKTKLEDIEGKLTALMTTRPADLIKAAEKHGDALEQAEERFSEAIEKAAKAAGNLQGLVPDEYLPGADDDDDMDNP